MLRGGRLLMTNAVLSVGSNMGDRLAYLRSALDRMRPCVDAVSPVYETPPWGPVRQPDYLNAVILASDDTADPPVWLARAHAAEDAAGRGRAPSVGRRTLRRGALQGEQIQTHD